MRAAKEPMSSTPKPAPAPAKDYAGALREKAAKLAAKGEPRDRERNTPKRACQAAKADADAANHRRAAQHLQAIADALEGGNEAAQAFRSTSAKDALHWTGWKISTRATGYYDYWEESGDWRDKGNEAQAFRSFFTPAGPSEHDEAAKLANKLARLKMAGIPGYFPTPAAVIERMIDLADIRATGSPQMHILEPSAGSGDILVALKEAAPDSSLHYCEINHELREVCFARTGRTADANDFMQLEGHGYQRVVMNPPFERRQDVAHVKRAFELLAPGGRLVAIMSPMGALQLQEEEPFDFTTEEYLESGTFKASGTSVSSVIIVADK